MRAYFRSWATNLVARCAGLLPLHRADWAAAMSAEVDAIDDDKAAFNFAVGCVWAATKERTLTMNFAARTVRFVSIGSMLALALAAAVIAGRVADAHAPNALVFGLTSALFAAAGIWSFLRGPWALVQTASTMIPVYLIAYAFVSQRGGADQSVYATLYRALAVEGIVIWAVLLAGGIFMLRAGALTPVQRT